MKKLQHRSITRLLEVFESGTHLFLVMEYVEGGDLLSRVKSKGALPEIEAKNIFK